MGQPTIDYLNCLQKSWQELCSHFLGLIIPQRDKTYFIKHQNANTDVLKILTESNITNYHSYVPEIVTKVIGK